MTLTLIRKASSAQSPANRLDLFGIVPDRLLGLDVASINDLPIEVGGQAATLKEHFEVVDGPRDALLLQGDLTSADRVGGGMQLGMLSVESSVGLWLGDQMRGGELIVHGSSGDYACCDLRGGRVRITQDVGDYCAAARPGSRRGMRGGVCLVQGQAGRFLANRMRRGTVSVRGDVGEGCGCAMIAGSIIVQGTVASPLAVGMRRGTIVLIQEELPPLPVGFTPFEPIKLSFLTMLLHEAEPELAIKCPSHSDTGTWQRALGDRASGGLGEILWFRPNASELLQ